MDLGLKTPAYKFPYLKLSMWDKDIVKYDDLIAETSLDLGYYFKKAVRNATDDAKKLNTIKVGIQVCCVQKGVRRMMGKHTSLYPSLYPSLLCFSAFLLTD